MSDLTEFLLARLAEDEAESQRAGNGDTDMSWGAGEITGYGMAVILDHGRALLECEVKRRIVDLHPIRYRGYSEQKITEVEPRTVRTSNIPVIDPELRLLALLYADHPDYREEWRP